MKNPKTFVDQTIALKLLLGLLILCGPASFQATAQGIHKDSALIRSWATHCVVDRGYIHLADTTVRDNNSNRATTGEEINATGEADGRVISLGDGGTAVYMLNTPLRDGPGPDFAVFENGFREQAPPYLWFLELAVVEVSSDGIHFVRFPAVSKTQTATQVAAFGQLNPADLTNLAGQYPAFYGTPFDLYELKDAANLDIENITHIRLQDVVGSIDPRYGTKDARGNMINDPYPTPFQTGGFDLDALAILDTSTADHHFAWGRETAEQNKLQVSIFPNPVSRGENFTIKIDAPKPEKIQISITNINHRTSTIDHRPSNIDHRTSTIHRSGYYFITVQSGTNRITKPLIVR